MLLNNNTSLSNSLVLAQEDLSNWKKKTFLTSRRLSSGFNQRKLKEMKFSEVFV